MKLYKENCNPSSGTLRILINVTSHRTGIDGYSINKLTKHFNVTLLLTQPTYLFVTIETLDRSLAKPIYQEP